MITEEQTEVVAFLESAATHGGWPVERIDTHASIVFLAGNRAWKLKRAVRYDYLDFSTAERRRAMCEAEVRINRRTAPAIYHRVVPVTREPTGRLALEGSGPPVEWLVEMARCDEEALLERLAARHALDVALMRPLAVAIARFHEEAERRRDHGGGGGIAWVIDGNAVGFAEFGRGVLDTSLCEHLIGRSRAALDRSRALLDRRRDTGFVRQCHGDLHLRNIVLINDTPTLFDAIEFNDEIACIDVLYDLAFLLMDLWHRGLTAHANRLFNHYLSESVDLEGYELLPLFLSCRAAVSAKTHVTAAALQSEADEQRALQEAARQYLQMAVSFLAPDAPRIVAIGGFSGSGKSTLAMRLAPSIGGAPGAVVLRSDEIRKQLFHVDPLITLGPPAYTPDVSRVVYDILVTRAEQLLRHGHSVIVDAVFADPRQRRAIEDIAAAAGVPFVGVWLDAPVAVLQRRLQDRRTDASDADVHVLTVQMRHATGPICWHRVDASGPTDRVLATARTLPAAVRLQPC